MIGICGDCPYTLSLTAAQPFSSLLPAEWTFVTTNAIYHLVLLPYTRAHSWCCVFYGFVHITVCTTVVSEYFHCPKIFSVLLTLASLCPGPIFFAALIGFPFPECQLVGIIQYIAFSDWLLSFGNVPLWFLHNFPRLISF